MYSRALTIDKLREIVEATGAKLISTEYINNCSDIEFKCSLCGELGRITWKRYCRGQNQIFLCKDCLKRKTFESVSKAQQKYSLDWVKKEFKKKGAVVVSDDYQDSKSKIQFKCSECGDLWEIQLSSYLSGKNKDLLCGKCYSKRQGKVKYYYEDVQRFFAENKVTLLSTEYKGVDNILDFVCVHCGGVAHQTLYNIMQQTGRRRFYCKDCIHGRRLNPNGDYGGEKKRHLYDLQWFGYIYKFFNLDEKDREIYSIHHIKQYKLFEDYRTSFCNGFPIKTVYHDLGAVDPITGLKNPFHVIDGYTDIKQFPEYVKLEYHTYAGFEFLDLNSKLVTEIIAPIENISKDYLLNRKLYFKAQGLEYIPIFFDELFVERRLNIICSMLRRVLYQWFSDIYNYTGQKYLQCDVDALNVEQVDENIAKEFYIENALWGYKNAEKHFGLYLDDTLVLLVSVARVQGNVYRIINYVEKLNCVVHKGLNKLARYIYNILQAEKLEFIFDRRFLVDAVELEYFEIVDYVAPNKFYMCPETNRYFKKMKKAEYWINTALDYGVPVVRDMKEVEGYIELFDCGEIVYAWKKN